MDDPRGDRLYELLMALFGSDAELQRFLALSGISSVETRTVQTKTRGLAESAYETVQALLGQGRVDASFFRLLERRAPDRAQDIHQVEQLFTQGASAPPTAPAPAASAPTAPAPAEPEPVPGPDSTYGEFARLLEQELASTPTGDPQAEAVDDDHLPWTGAASVLGSFNPLELRPLPVRPPSPLRATSALVGMITVSHQGRWVLRDEERRAALIRLDEGGLLGDALTVTDHLDDPRRALVERVLQGATVPLAELDQHGLVDLDAVLGWLEPLGHPLPLTRTDVHAAADRRALIDPLRLLVGSHFRGREQELSMLRTQVSADGSPEPMFVVGAGGAGKSTLLGKVLLELEEQAPYDPVPFAYIDFDKARHDPRDRAGLLQQLARQLRLLYATSAAAATFAAVESTYGGTDLERAAELLDLDRDLTEDAVLDTLCANLDELQRHQHRPRTVPLVLVLDTCEEVISKGPGAVRDLWSLLHDLRLRLPDMRVVVAGRALLPVPEADRPDNVLRLGDLDPVAADAVLENRGVREPGLRRLIVERFGRNPLTLRLAAEALSRAGTAQEAFAGLGTPSPAYAEVAMEQVQGMLYTRILGHIRDPEVASVAHPGLAVRKVTVPVIRDVLAAPCQLDPARADEVFDKLRAELTLFDEESPGVLSHRQDVRRLMLRTMADDPARRIVVQQIHGRAAEFYGRLPGVEARTEQLYHRLMGDEDPRLLGRLWDDSVRTGLESALDEPLPERARRWLERRLSRVPETEDRSEWEQEDWEVDAAARARSWLASRDPVRAQAVLAERDDRLPGSVVHALDVAVKLALDDVPAAAAALDRGLHRGFEGAPAGVQLELLEQAVEVRARQGDARRLLESATSCSSLGDLLGEPARGTRALSTALAALIAMEATAEAETAQRLLAGRFEALTRSQMRSDPDLVREVLHTVGLVDTGVLMHAAAEMGDQTSEVDGVFAVDPFALGRVLDDTTSEAGPALRHLAVEVGLPSQGWTTDELASRLVRTGRTGKAVALGLQYADDAERMRTTVVDSLVLPTSYPSKRTTS